jgi:hypothetical protein
MRGAAPAPSQEKHKSRFGMRLLVTITSVLHLTNTVKLKRIKRPQLVLQLVHYVSTFESRILLTRHPCGMPDE